MEPSSGSVGLNLPSGVVTPGDVRRLRRELKNLEDSLQQMRLRTTTPIAKLPRLGRQLEEFSSTNRLNMLLPDDRQRSAAFLEHTLGHAPVLHIAFATEASRSFTTQIVLWFRQNIQNDVLLSIGLEPSIAAGCVLRTPNKQFDFSLRSHFAKQTNLLVDKLKAEPTNVG
ncbi:MAG: hypothetical protein WC498_00335 [Candidatus Saccharimonadales bacterium]